MATQSQMQNFPFLTLSRLKIDKKIIEAFSKEIVNKYKFIPISLLGDQLTVAMADPQNVLAVDNIKASTEYTISLVVGQLKDIENVIRENYVEIKDEKKSEDIFNAIIKDIKDTEDLELVQEAFSSRGELVEELKDEAPIIKLTESIIQQAVAAKASDIFIEPLESAVRVRYRIDGVIREIDRMDKVLHFPIISRIKVISNLDISEHRLPQDGRFKTVSADGKAVDFRVNVLPTATGEKIVLRILDQEGSVSGIDDLGFEPDSLRRLKGCVFKPHGLLLTCGPTGSGKTTTLYSILKHVNSVEKNIVTVEDPVEYQLKGANQVNIKPAMGLTFPASLRSILRQDPDIILIGEIRDAETLDIAVKAALTGHLVLSSLHTTTAAGSITRMINMGIEPFLICSSVLAIVAQRLLRRICVHCKESYIVQSETAKKVGLSNMVKSNEIELFRGKGCKQCLKTGYKGRIGITEILVLSPEIKDLILSRVGESKTKEVARKEGMKTMREDGFAKALKGLTSLEEVLRVTAPDDEL
ncbi:Type IV fimbrial assembly, ATPase PilB [hydrothermal vent metagenome]|uniref:Type IV fimbrial assembly, ATPase PilB n=1 Tax=hydrothermal vent metagenome TaxID=652676 RepID=A0A3B1E4V6_9ZZZZ